MTTTNINPAHRLSGEETETWRNLSSFRLGLPAQLDTRLRRRAGISHHDFCALHHVATAERRPVRMSELATTADMSLSHLSRVVTRLEKRGLARRLPDPHDGRTTLVDLTRTGWSLYEENVPAHIAEIRRLVFDNLTPEESRALGSALRKMAASVRDADGAHECAGDTAEAV
ncbi:MarR family winged helix-turn-helix transcriptional regulator [Corynebacterium guangdongense]|uniref:DNA-binding MarR family transcriptional regulator n=1 Tax=Corynebacterium guangdongense TaxID=1783348 RepID=A0ABU2A230_9CORY|nr:MarR family transcriptional regulator [Corynebacterium guangdongense]MDR7330168.1 DNA-binding MarR family transcriptional regulator [Corynebacterium guangdongense]WJZ18726.1 transcriptional repressor MprA [Corynebacterium guangdongense]